MADENLRRKIQAREKDIEAFLLRLDSVFSRTIRTTLAGLEEGNPSAQDAARVLGSLETSMLDAGLEEAILDLQSTYGDELAEIRDLFARQAVAEEEVFADIDIDVIEELINFDVDQVTQIAQQAIGDMRSQLMRSVIAGETPDVASIANAISERVQAQLRTELNTLLAGFARSVTVGKAKDLGFELFEYLGPDDSITRDFCADLLSRDPPIYTREEIESMDNDQGLDVFAYGGGYNCRHEWSPISEENARELGWEP